MVVKIKLVMKVFILMIVNIYYKNVKMNFVILNF